jgi:UDP-2,3-diacylglucosamine pyrophosphatase LpxH
MDKNVVLNGNKVTISTTYPFRIGLISDLHIGAQHGIFPPDFSDAYGLGYKLNGGQIKLWEYLNQFIGKLKEFKINTLIVLGDVIAGKNVKELGTYIIGTDLKMQKDAAVEVLGYICKNVPTIQKVILLRGTPYHGARDMPVEEAVADGLTIKYKVNASYAGEYMFLDLKYNGKKKTLWLAHPATGASVYPETTLGRDIGMFLQAYATGKLPKVDMIIRAHRHEFIELHKSSIRYMVLPCWQFYVPYDKAVEWYSKWQPDIGGAILLADDEMRLRPLHFVYPNIVDPEKYITFNSKNDPYKVEEKCLSKK